MIGAHTGPASAVALNPNGNAAYSAGDDGVLKFWTLPPTPARPLAAPHADAVTALALSADGNHDPHRQRRQDRPPLHLRQRPAGARLPGPTGRCHVRGARRTPRRRGHGRPAPLPLERRRRHARPPGRRPTPAPSPASPSTPQGTQMLTCGGDGLLKLWALPAAPTRVLTHPDAVAVGRRQRRRQARLHRRRRQDRPQLGPGQAAAARTPVLRPSDGRRRRGRQPQRPAARLGRRRRR